MADAGRRCGCCGGPYWAWTARTVVRLLHLLPWPTAVLAEVARVLRPGGVLATTVAKDDACFVPDGDAARSRRPCGSATGPGPRRPYPGAGPAAGQGLRPVGETVFPGAGQGRSPRRRLEVIASDRTPWCTHAESAQVAEACGRLAALPEQGGARPDPLHRLVALREEGAPSRLGESPRHH